MPRCSWSETGGSGARIAFENSGKLNDREGVVGLSHLEGDRDSGDSQFYVSQETEYA